MFLDKIGRGAHRGTIRGVGGPMSRVVVAGVLSLALALAACDRAGSDTPKVAPPVGGTTAATSAATAFIWPVLGRGVRDPLANVTDARTDGWHVANGFGDERNFEVFGCAASAVFHPGEDWNRDDSADAGDYVYAVADGDVIRVADLGNLGWMVIIRHSLGGEIDAQSYALAGTELPGEFRRARTVTSAYLHLTDVPWPQLDIRKKNVPVSVGRGTPVGRIAGGLAVPPHLHFEIRANQGPSEAQTAVPGNCGYYSSRQEITDFGYINPSAFLHDHALASKSPVTRTATPQPGAAGTPTAPSSTEPRTSLHLVRSETPEGMNGPTVHIFRVEGIELRGKQARVDVTPRGNGVVNEVENYVLAYVPSDEPSGTYRVVLWVEGQQAETTIEYKERGQARPPPTASPTPAPAVPTPPSPRPTQQTAEPSLPAVTNCSHASAPYLSGTIRDASTGIGIAGVLVETIDLIRGSPYGCFGYTDASGRYRLPRGDGKYRVLAFPTTPGPYGERWWPNSPSWWGAGDVVVKGTDVTGIDIALTPGFSISGQISQAGTGLPIPGATVCVYQALPATITGSECLYAPMDFADETGRYRIPNISPGAYYVCFNLLLPNLSGGGIPASECVTARAVSLSSDVSSVDAAFSVVIVAGQVVDQKGGAPIAGVLVSVYSETSAACAPTRCNPVLSRATDQSGHYVVYAPPGTYRILFRRAGHDPHWWQNGQTFAGATPITLNRNIDGIDVALP